MKIVKLNNKGWGTLEMFIFSGGLLLALLVSVTLISVLYKDQEKKIRISKYRNLENKIAVAAEEYVLQNNIVVNNDIRIKYSTLKSEGYIKNVEIIVDRDCDGYVIVSNNGLVNHYDAYVSCKDYQTENYN